MYRLSAATPPLLVFDQVLLKSRPEREMSKSSLELWCCCYCRFRPAVVTKVMQQVLQEKLDKASYDAETAFDTAKQLADSIKSKLQGGWGQPCLSTSTDHRQNSALVVTSMW
jgi:hypothetical protein